MALYELDGHRPVTPQSGNFWVAENATVIGRTTLHEDVSVWFNAVIRADNEAIVVGARTNIQEHCVLHVDPGHPLKIEENSLIGHKVILHGCTIGRGCLIGMGAIILNGAKIGENCLVGAGALVPEGKEIPPRSLVIGAPGRVARELSDEDIARMHRGVDVYCARWRQYKAGLVKIA